MSRAELSSSDFDYDLAEGKIAKHPLAKRNDAKLLIYEKGIISESVFSALETHLPSNTSLVFNDTKVLAARLHFKNSNGAKIEIFCLEPYQTTVEESLSTQGHCTWLCLVGNLKRFKKEETLQLAIANTTLKAKLVEKRSQDIIITFEWEGDISFSSIIEEAGEVPLPPYLNRSTEATDKKNYQTVYAQKEGAVAAPTAGLHFTDAQLSDLRHAGHSTYYLTLHVGAGTFRPIKSSTLVAHQMHQERMIISKESIQNLRTQEGKIVSVGTTSLRSLESIYWLAIKMKENTTLSVTDIQQEDAYTLPSDWSWKQAYSFLLDWMNTHEKDHIAFYSSLFIMPGYEWKVIDGLVTNFHQPKSTLLALVASWIGDDWKKVYTHALANEFRFLSFGDASLLWKNT